MTTKEEKKDLTVLVMDDEKGIRDLLSYELSSQGYTVITAHDGEDGIKKVRENDVQLVISDIKMPKMDGIKALEEIKKINPEIEVIMATGYGTIDTAVDSMKKGAYDFVQKPFNIDEILGLVDKALEKSELKSLIALYETSKAIFAALKIEELLPVLVKLSIDLLKADDVSIMLMGNDKKLYIAASHGLDTEIKKNSRMAIGECIAEQMSGLKDTCVILSTAATDTRFPGLKLGEDIKSSIISVLSAKGRIEGVLCVTRTKSTIPFNNSDKRYADIFSSQVSQAIDNAQLYFQLESKIKDLNDAYNKLSEMQQELVQVEKLAAIGELASGVAHELNNPLTVVIGLVQLMIEEGGLCTEKKNDLETIKEQAERCRKIILNLLQFSRKHESQKLPLKIEDVVDKCIELVEYDFKNFGVRVVKDYPAKLPLIKADFYQMEQVFLNIINNAFCSMDKRPNPQLTISISEQKKKIFISFTDNGCGISESIIGKIFDPFFTTKGVKNGTGLGLSISYGIVKEHDGEITVKSKVGTGSTFTVILPIEEGIQEGK